MSLLRFRSAEAPFADARVAGEAARLLALLEAIGVWHPGALVDTLGPSVFGEALEALAGVDIGVTAPFEWKAHAEAGPEEFARWIRTVRAGVAASPVPEAELPRLDDLFGTARLAGYLGIAPSSLRRYLGGEREVPDDVALRAHLVARIVGDLAGTYNERGIRRWFERPRHQLSGRAPEEILRARWAPEDDDVVAMGDLATALTI